MGPEIGYPQIDCGLNRLRSDLAWLISAFPRYWRAPASLRTCVPPLLSHSLSLPSSSAFFSWMRSRNASNFFTACSESQTALVLQKLQELRKPATFLVSAVSAVDDAVSVRRTRYAIALWMAGSFSSTSFLS